jgi:hypothetical protein
MDIYLPLDSDLGLGSLLGLISFLESGFDVESDRHVSDLVDGGGNHLV